MSSPTLTYLIIDDLEQPSERQVGTLVRLSGRRDSAKTRQGAIELVRHLWEEDLLPANRFANGIHQDSIMAVSEPTDTQTLRPVERGGPGTLSTPEPPSDSSTNLSGSTSPPEPRASCLGE